MHFHVRHHFADYYSDVIFADYYSAPIFMKVKENYGL